MKFYFGSCARSGKVRGQTPRVEKKEKPKKAKGFLILFTIIVVGGLVVEPNTIDSSLLRKGMIKIGVEINKQHKTNSLFYS